MELLRLLLLEDEYIILEGLKKTYDWEKMGYRVVGAYTEAEDAIADLPTIAPQVVLSDIRMRNMDGLEFFRQVREEIPDCLGVFISAYRNFDYARKACELGAFAYLPKPFKDEEITEVMGKAREEYLKKREAISGYLAAKYLTSQKNAAFVNAMVERYARQQMEDDGMERLLGFASGRADEELKFACLIADVDIACVIESEMKYEAIRFEMYELVEAALRKFYPIWFFAQENGSKVFIVDVSQGKGSPAIRELVAEIRREREVELISAISREYPGISGIQSAYQQAKQLYEIMLGYGKGLFLAEDERLPAEKGSLEKQELEVIDAIRRNDGEALRNGYKNLIYGLPSNENDAKLHLLRFAIRVDFYIRETYGENEQLSSGFQAFYRQSFSISGTAMVDILYKLLLRAVSERIEYCQEKSSDYLSSYIRQAEDYINMHYSEEELSVSDVARALYLNPVYFGRMFKQAVGVSFRRYLMNVRMEKARELLSQGKYGVVQVGEMVGIGNPSYFTQVFKQYTGKVPSEFTGESV